MAENGGGAIGDGAAGRAEGHAIRDQRSAPLPFPLSPEDRGRADFYALLARLYADGPDARVLAAIGEAESIAADTPFAGAWNRLVAASAAMDAEAAMQEYTDLFVGVGKCDVNLHASHWLAGAMMDKPLVALRADLAALALARRADITMLEDHLSALCETMRLLITGQHDRKPAPVAMQRTFFERHIASWVFACCTAIRESTIANYYGRVAEFTEQYMALDRDALAMDE